MRVDVNDTVFFGRWRSVGSGPGVVSCEEVKCVFIQFLIGHILLVLVIFQVEEYSQNHLDDKDDVVHVEGEQVDLCVAEGYLVDAWKEVNLF